MNKWTDFMCIFNKYPSPTDPSFMYHAAYMVAHARLPRWAEPFAGVLANTKRWQECPAGVLGILHNSSF